MAPHPRQKQKAQDSDQQATTSSLCAGSAEQRAGQKKDRSPLLRPPARFRQCTHLRPRGESKFCSDRSTPAHTQARPASMCEQCSCWPLSSSHETPHGVTMMTPSSPPLPSLFHPSPNLHIHPSMLQANGRPTHSQAASERSELSTTPDAARLSPRVRAPRLCSRRATAAENRFSPPTLVLMSLRWGACMPTRKQPRCHYC